MTHTPGPWTAAAEPYDDGTPYFRIEAGDPWIANEDTMGFRISAIMRGPDAQLIIAAPEMLAALQEVMGWIHTWDPNFVQDDDWSATRALAGAAIAKATGTTP